MNIEYRSHYFDDARAKASFERYAKRIFGLDFSRWKERGLWDDQYIPFSAFVGDECIASICVYPSEITVNGRREKWAQLLTVGTLPEYRLRGIQRELWKRAENWIKEHCEQVFLFTDDSAAGFYDKLGLKRQAEHYDVIRISTDTESREIRSRKLDMESDTDFAILKRLANKREPVSNRLGFHNPNLLLFMFLYPFRDHSYYIEEMNSVIVVEELPDRLRVHDIVAARMPRIGEILPYLKNFKKEEIEFLFCTDRLGLNNPEKREMKDSILFVDDKFKLDGEFVFPSSIRA